MKIKYFFYFIYILILLIVPCSLLINAYNSSSIVTSYTFKSLNSEKIGSNIVNDITIS